MMESFNNIEVVSVRKRLASDVDEVNQPKKARVEYKQQFADDLFLAISYLNSEKYIHIRKYYVVEGERWLPTRIGIYAFTSC
jgi:hypothetical protein